MMIKARYVAPIDSPVIEDGAVVIADGRIAAVGPAEELRVQPVTDYGDALVCPGLINAHTHLELGCYRGRVDPTPDFVDWIEGLVRLGRAEPLTNWQATEAVRAGADEMLQQGVTVVGDITSNPRWTRHALASTGLRGVSFGEVLAIGKQRHLLAERLDAAAAPTDPGWQIRTGISPHAPYTVEPAAMRACAERARVDNAPLCIHLAECEAEDAFTMTLEGALADLLRRLEVWDDGPPGAPGSMHAAECRPVELADRTGLLGKRTIIAHANYVSDEDLGCLAERGVSVAYCPRTHHAFRHEPHRFRDMLAHGINVCLGTDSLTSSPSLSILDELRFLRREHPDVLAEDLLAMGTLRGARALGLDGEVGSLTPGKMADLVVIPCEPVGEKPAWEDAFDGDAEPIAVYLSGRLL